MNDNHIKHSEIFENNLLQRAVQKLPLLEEIVESNLLLGELKKAIDSLSEVQRRRIKLYYFEDETLEQIAKIENCSKVVIKYSIDYGSENY